ncbi:Nif3-like dinuclear metal center hexameric protein [Mucilaginibacter sp. HMF5004]|uniref:Nif3-like dinuclear metal center hexameric protein n=1 Tax=Mucilaginibacter rivuli TaxID=2857527 RepID=UPI001C5FC6E5|nr:Nif3-like dinuclear metal center hexameric protein [Mucilaginibacter rivuli]MBW4890382.1 Nif3-like dinuclear metal center hexameric protein [Mucilaginibacter rivuli]
MKLHELTNYLESLAPLAYQEDYDNSGLIVGHPDKEINQALVSLDCTEAVVDDAIAKDCQVIISHHPIVFKGLKKLNGKTYVERVIEKAIKNNIAIYAIHTNLDAVAHGVNARICETLGITDCRILAPKHGILKKLVTYVPVNYADKVRAALFAAGAGQIGNYSECSFNTEGIGTFKAGENTDPFIGQKGITQNEPEVKIETVYPASLESKILVALFMEHPYEEVAYDLYPLTNQYPTVGSGMIGELAEPMSELDFLQMVKYKMNAGAIRYTKLRNKSVKRVAVCGGSGSFLLKNAIGAGADVFVTADFKYHEFFDAEEKLVIADIGHFESEQFTQNLIVEIIKKKFVNFAVRLTEVNTNPIKYLI